jgi:hypothetical protein
MMRFKVERRVPEKWAELRWCIIRLSDDELVAHRDRKVDADEMCVRLNNGQPVEATPENCLKGLVSFERSMSHHDSMMMHRVTRGESYRVEDTA